MDNTHYNDYTFSYVESLKNRKSKTRYVIILLILLFLLAAAFIVFRPKNTGNMHYPVDSISVSYCQDGTFSWSLQSDYVDNYEGKWSLIPVGGKLLLFQEPTSLQTSHSKEVRQLKDGEVLQGIGKVRYRAYQTSATLASNVKSLDYIKQQFPQFAAITNKSWQKVTTQDSEFRPMHLRFNDDGTYLATSKNDCRHTAPWAMSISSGSIVNLSLYDYSFCDTRESTTDKYSTAGLSFLLELNKLTDRDYDYNSYVIQ